MSVLGIDIGTTSISMVLMDSESKEMIAGRTVNHASFLEGAGPGEKIQDPEKIWALTKEMMEDMLCRYGIPKAIGLTGQMHGICYVDGNEAVTPLYTWQDERGGRLLPGGRSALDILREATGSAALGYGLVTHLYLQKTGQIPRRAKKMAGISDYIAMRLCNMEEPVIQADMAASWGGFHLEEGDFYRGKLEEIGMDLFYLPQVEKKPCFLGKTKEGIPVMTPIGDNQASFLGSVEDLRDTVLINVGTGSQVSFFSEKYLESRGAIELRPCAGEGYLLAGSSLCGGRSYALLEGFYREISGRKANLYEKMYEDAESFIREHGMGKIWKVRTTFAGTRENPEETGEIQGITVDNFHPGAMTAGIIEGILTELYERYEVMCERTGRRAGRLAGSGNGLRQNLLMQKMAEEMFGLKLEIPRHKEEAACGAALCAGKLL